MNGERRAVRIVPGERHWGWRLWLDDAAPWRGGALMGVSLNLGRYVVVLMFAERGHWRCRSFWRRPSVWLHRASEMAEASWWRFTVFVERDPISVSLR